MESENKRQNKGLTKLPKSIKAHLIAQANPHRKDKNNPPTNQMTCGLFLGNAKYGKESNFSQEWFTMGQLLPLFHQLLHKNKHAEATFRVQAQEAILLRV